MEAVTRSIVVIGPPDTFELVESLKVYRIAGYLSPQEEVRSIYPQYTHLGDDGQIQLLVRQGYCFTVALKSNTRRQQLIEHIIDCGGEVVVVKHPDATVFDSAELMIGTVVAPQAIVSACAKIGRGVVVNYGSVVGHDVEVGNWSFIAPGVKLLGYSKIGSNVFIGANCVIYPYVTIGDNVTISANTTVTKKIHGDVKVIGIDKKRMISSIDPL